MKIQFISDIHNEFGILNLPHSDDENQKILVLAGDVGIAVKPATYVDFIAEMTNRFRHVIYIMGNHEHWKGNFSQTLSKLKENLNQHNNLSILEKDYIVIDNVAFVCATMWTDMNKYDPNCMYQSQLMMRDYRVIRHGPKSEPWRRKFEPEDTVIDHAKATEFIFTNIVEHKKQGRKVVVITHHAPCSLSLEEHLKTDILSGAYHSSLENEIIDLGDNQPDVWIHGHVHKTSDYLLDKTRVLCNPRGYYSVEENRKFDPLKYVEI